MTLLTHEAFPLTLVRRGKVRELYDAGNDELLMVASDRISAFDVIMGESIPRKGEVLTQVSAFWFDLLQDVFPSHFITADVEAILARLPMLVPAQSALSGRTMVVRRTAPVPFECVVRGYLSGSAWAEYQRSGTLAGEPLPAGLQESQRLDPPLFSPATKAHTGHDENVPFSAVIDALGRETAHALRDASLEIYDAGRRHAADRGIIIADTKFEFGTDADDRLVLIDEVLTPDSSRFWPADQWAPGAKPPSFDKQPLRDYLAGLKQAGRWDGNAPPPPLSREVVRATSERYLDAFLRLTGAPLPPPAP